MRTETKTIKIYKFEELPESIQEKVIEKFRENNLDYDWWNCIYDDFITICAILGIETEHKKIFFTGFSSQGDGACFEGHYSYKKGSVKALKEYAPRDTDLFNIAKNLQDIQKTAFYQLSATVKHSGHYYHKYCTQINVIRNDNQEITNNQENGIIECLRDLMQWLYKTLNAEYDYLQSDEAIKETIEANEYEYLENGKQYYI